MKSTANILWKAIAMSIISLIFLLTSCDSGLAITKVEIKNLPTKIVYYRGIDTELDLEGGTVMVHTRDSDKRGGMGSEYAIGDGEGGKVTISSDIDFNVVGVYEVVLSWGTHIGEVYRYNVAVIEPE